MLASNNGDPRQCAANLLKLTRGENPFERIKGIDAAITDAPSASAQYDAIEEAEWVIDTYEPRVEIEGIDFDAQEAQSGDFSTITQIKLREEEDNE
ncbi:early E1A protein [Lacrimispora defluvii]|uniref:Early E1A protein n=1 Tax=Lacrimispora defluvii TaxID=2719233 RepID=A0ABX1VV23_9FIRM|nr:early E1A protein [Lacrimispora defluvii]NNJ30083.1 early E1A protein [Lacrimispora defluvii]